MCLHTHKNDKCRNKKIHSDCLNGESGSCTLICPEAPWFTTRGSNIPLIFDTWTVIQIEDYIFMNRRSI